MTDPQDPNPPPPSTPGAEAAPGGEDSWQQWFEAVWAHREDVVYRERFVDLGKGIYTPKPELYTQDMHQKEFHPGWLHHGVLECPPGDHRATWLYVTSGLSNPWNVEEGEVDPSGFSGLGFELMFECTEQAPWVVPVLHRLQAYEMLVAVGRFPGAELFEYGNRIPLNASLAPALQSEITWLLVEPPKVCAPWFELASGRVDFFELVGLTEAEARFAREQGHDALVERLVAGSEFPVTDPRRASLIG